MDRKVPSHSGKEPVPLYDRLTAGIAVNTFIANAIELEVPAQVISEFTGIRQDSRVKKIKQEIVKDEIRKLDSR